MVGLALLSPVAATGTGLTLPPPRTYGFFPVYPIIGGAVTSVATMPAEGRQVIIYQPDSVGNIVSVLGYSSIQGGKFDINPFRVTTALAVGGTYLVAVPRGSDNYGANPVELTISGLGYEHLDRDLILAYGAGPTASVPGAPVVEPAPGIQLWFNNRLYQLTPAQIAQGDKFVISDQPKIKAVVSISEPYAVASGVSGYSVTIDPGTPAARSLTLNASHLTSQVYAAEAGAQNLRSLNLEYSVTEPLAEGAHTVSVSAQSSGLLGTASTATALATVEVMGGPVRLLGAPLCWPSPFSITKDKTVTIQYTLSKNAPIEIVLTDISGVRSRNFIFEAGSEGGSAGLNKVTWNGRTDRSQLAGNGIYLGLIIARDEGRRLGSVKLTVVD
jgi:hypothetical protein